MQRRSSDRYAKLRLLLGREMTAANNVAFWQRAVTAPTEQWRGEAAINSNLAQALGKLDDVERAIAAEMRCLLGQQSNGQLVVRRDGSGNGDDKANHLSMDTDIRFVCEVSRNCRQGAGADQSD